MIHPNVSNHLKADGNLSYLQFVALVGKIWEEAHPDVRLVATGTNRQDLLYPCIMYRLDLRKPHPNEPKPRYREEIPTKNGDPAIIIGAQRFQSIITFTAMSQMDPRTVEILIEMFEDFMIEFQPVFKELGVSELVYARRNPDVEDERPGFGVTERSVSYLLTTEKIIKSTFGKLDQIMIDARVFLRDWDYGVLEDATPSNATPSVRPMIIDNLQAQGNLPFPDDEDDS